MQRTIQLVTGLLTVLMATPSLGAVADLRLVEAAKGQNIGAVRALLGEGEDVLATPADGMTALHWAAQWDHTEMVDVLVGAGADVNAAAQ